ncbi:hypothetical protein MPSEU_000422400 [Mayamaea pseudoterrestris]|nr:hypothetical protein MPSEU_000422400 [Mayamaea pseudoterrestris]
MSLTTTNHFDDDVIPEFVAVSVTELRNVSITEFEGYCYNDSAPRLPHRRSSATTTATNQEGKMMTHLDEALQQQPYLFLENTYCKNDLAPLKPMRVKSTDTTTWRGVKHDRDLKRHQENHHESASLSMQVLLSSKPFLLDHPVQSVYHFNHHGPTDNDKRNDEGKMKNDNSSSVPMIDKTKTKTTPALASRPKQLLLQSISSRKAPVTASLTSSSTSSSTINAVLAPCA